MFGQSFHRSFGRRNTLSKNFYWILFSTFSAEGTTPPSPQEWLLLGVEHFNLRLKIQLSIQAGIFYCCGSGFWEAAKLLRPWVRLSFKK